MRCARPPIPANLALSIVVVAAGVLVGTTPAWALTVEQKAKLLASDGANWDRFGYWVAADGDTAVIGAHGDDDNGSSSGAAYVFGRAAGEWTEKAKLLPADGAQGDEFGYSVALDGDTAIVGAFRDDDNGLSSGSAYVFTRAAGVWTEEAKLVPTDGESGDEFGVSVALDGNTAIVSAHHDDDNGPFSGSAYVFARAGGVWTEQAKLLASDGAASDSFGESVALDGDTAIVGAFRDDDNGSSSGSAFVFTRVGSVWTEQAKLLPADGATGDWFGFGPAVDGDTAVIGAVGDDASGHRSGSAYVFTRAASVWTEEAKLVPADGEGGDEFGFSVALDGDTAVIGGSGNLSGSAYAFTRMGSLWVEQAKVFPVDGTSGEQFGSRVALDGDTVVIGASGDDDSGTDSGSAYVFRLYDDDVPAVGGISIVLLWLAMLGIGAYYMRRRAVS